MAAGSCYLVVSDLHLCDVEDHTDGWKSYKSSKFLFDEDFRELLKKARDDAGDAPLTLILNGDIVDFDLVTAVPEKPPWRVDMSEHARGLDATEPKSVWKLGRVLDCHPVFVEALVDHLAAGHRIVYIMGNHDREFHFPAVRQTFMDLLRVRLEARGAALADGAVRFEPWFFHAKGEIFAEHGQQYDAYTSFFRLLSPTVRFPLGAEQLAIPMGNLSNRYLMSRMGFFNPHASDYILNFFSYVVHWLKFYALSKRSLVLTWLVGSFVVVWKLVKVRPLLLLKPADLRARLRKVADSTGIAPETVGAIYALQRPPIITRFYRLVREFWIDRLLIAAFMTAGTVTLALVPIPLWIKLMVPLSTFPLLYFIYEWAAQGESIFTIERRFPNVARAIAALLPVRVVTFGHTHAPRLIPILKNAVFVDTGTWAPITQKRRPDRLAPGFRNYLWVSFGEGEPVVRFGSWYAGSRT
ncbi:MAG: metallophosphoesterase [Deltaproteobacteria bacterium]|nr:metallophosphoesterase [Deltaproteobacteria bacterium]